MFAKLDASLQSNLRLVMKRLRILCAKKGVQGVLKGQITHIGGVNGTGDKWNISTKEAIEGINSKTWEFYITENLEELKVTVSTSTDSDPILSAKGQGYLHNLVEDLPECP